MSTSKQIISFSKKINKFTYLIKNTTSKNLDITANALRRRSKKFFLFCSLFSILCSFFRRFFLSCIFSRHQPKRRRETSTEGKHLYTSTLEWALVFSFHPRDVVRHQPREDILLHFLEISTQETS